MMRIGLFGGTFDPIHIGHLRAAQEVCEAFALENCYLIPSAVPPHKETRGIADAGARLEMACLAVENMPFLKVSDVEVNRPGLSFTVDTVKHYRTALPREAEIYLIIGLDAFLEIDTWYRFEELIASLPIVVMARPPLAETRLSRSRLERFLRERLSDRYVWDERRSGFIHPARPGIFVAQITLLDISSSEIRRRICDGMSIRYLLPESVEAYIKDKGLYR